MERIIKRIIIACIIALLGIGVTYSMYKAAKRYYDIETITLTEGIVREKIVDHRYKGSVDRIVVIETEKYGTVSEEFEVVSFSKMNVGDTITWKYNYVGAIKFHELIGSFVWVILVIILLSSIGSWLFKDEK